MAGYTDNDDRLDGAAQIAVLRLIAARSAAAGPAAAAALSCTGPAARQLRLDRLIPDALGDKQATWTGQERQQIAALAHPAAA